MAQGELCVTMATMLDSFKWTRREALKKGTVATAGLTMGGAAFTGTVAAGPDIAKIKCGQTKVGDISSDDPVRSNGIKGDVYRFGLDAPASVHVTVVGHGPGNDKGNGNKGGDGAGKGQQTSEPFLAIVPAGTTLSFANLIMQASDIDGDLVAEFTVSLPAGEYDIHVQDLTAIDGPNEPMKYQLSVDCN